MPPEVVVDVVHQSGRRRARITAAAVAVITALVVGTGASARSAAAVGVPTDTRQLVVGVADAWSSANATLQRYARKASGKKLGPWVAVGAPFPARLGSNGLAWGIGMHEAPRGSAAKREGDDRSPAGIFALSTAFGYSPAWTKRTKLPYVTVGPRDLFVEDPASPHYNSHVRLDHAPMTDWERREQMYQTDPAHRLQVLVDHNRTARPTPGAGSAIFIHIWRGDGAQATAGCTSVSDGDIEMLLSWLDPAAKPVYALLPAAEYQTRQKAWALPLRSAA